MNAITIVILGFSVIGAVDYILGNKLVSGVCAVVLAFFIYKDPEQKYN